jgi:hypothetical protein
MKGAGSLLVFRVKKAIFGERFKEVTPVTRYLVCRFVLSAAMVPVAVSHDPEESKPLMPEGDMAAACTRGLAGALSARLTPKPTNKYLPKPEQKRLHRPGRAQTRRRLTV